MLIDLKKKPDIITFNLESILKTYPNKDNLTKLLRSDGTIILVNKDYAEKHFHKCDICGKYYEVPLTHVDDIQTVCDKCLKEEYELVDGSYVLKSE